MRQPILRREEDRRTCSAAFARRRPDRGASNRSLLNGAPGARVLLDGVVDTVVSFAFDGGRISTVLAVRNPDKLRHLGTEVRLSR